MPLPSYDIDFTKMIKQCLAIVLRKSKTISWLNACLKALRTVHDDFLSFTSSKLTEIKYNGQTFILQQLLINKFGAGIYITNNQNSSNGFFIGSGTDISAFIATKSDVRSFIDTSYSVSQYSFTVHVSASITFVMSELVGYVNQYKMYGTTFNVVIE